MPHLPVLSLQMGYILRCSRRASLVDEFSLVAIWPCLAVGWSNHEVQRWFVWANNLFKHSWCRRLRLTLGMEIHFARDSYFHLGVNCLIHNACIACTHTARLLIGRRGGQSPHSSRRRRPDGQSAEANCGFLFTCLCCPVPAPRPAEHFPPGPDDDRRPAELGTGGVQQPGIAGLDKPLG